ncbi:MAG: hypothetical protein COT71_01190 [Candidatus Andersenbacteria bacterium CG10_big_fil_rev_8_21_14_0_10_54_11]|uniref:Uncharacterized protein n=1 Tax=Candidatus Andersenbacteria bacterium CG10_big_fil_rev_8_21_14_0_10_54_11 TaxID=1974485 RepID=A0A2M6X016_9BACT|nr:MAG: hypothetical protein COT71_01190 [Candidatus Andersenbacteria bacterium CG10_big_fil_rev_8_21_14_0_10_54_11]
MVTDPQRAEELEAILLKGERELTPEEEGELWEASQPLEPLPPQEVERTRHMVARLIAEHGFAADAERERKAKKGDSDPGSPVGC